MANSEWREICGWEGRYDVSDCGEIRSWYYGKKRLDKPVIRKLKIDKYGYPTVCLKSQGIAKTYTVHRLVAIAFIPNPNNLTQINHKDGNKLNNTIDNLEWCSPKANIIHAYKSGLISFEKQSSAQKKRYSKAEEREKAREIALKLYSNEEHREKVKAAHNTEAYLKAASERRKKQTPPTAGRVRINNGVVERVVTMEHFNHLSSEWKRGRLKTKKGD